MSLLDFALGYARRGWAVVPLHTPTDDRRCDCRRGDCDKPGKHPRTMHGLNDATTDEEQIRKWWGMWPWANIGIITGSASGLVVIDVDAKDGGLESLAELDGRLPSTVETLTGGGGRHLLYAHPGGAVRTVIANNTKAPPLGAGIDVLGDGGRYFVAPPSLHMSGAQYEWVQGPGEQELAPLPTWLLQALAKPEAAPVEPTDEGPVQKGDRHRHLLTCAARMRDGGLGAAAILAGLLEENATRLNPPKADEEVRKIADWIAKKPIGRAKAAARAELSREADPNPESLPTEKFELSDLGNAERLANWHGADLRFCDTWGKWLAWDGRKWGVDDTQEAKRRAKSTVRRMATEAFAEENDERRKALLKHAAKSESAAAVRNMLQLAQAELPILPAALDGDPWLLNVQNGTVNLKTGELRPHRREAMITKIAPVDFDVGAPAHAFERFLSQVVPDDEIRAFVQRAVGYALSGDVSEQVLFFLYGEGKNGKSTLLTIIQEILGTYAVQAPPRLLVMKKDGSEEHATEVARLFGARFAVCTELEQGARFAESKIKALTGDDMIPARRMREDWWEFRPTHKLFIAANHKPEIRGTDEGIWRRPLMVPFNVKIPADQRDPHLKDKIRREYPGVLAWAVRGCLSWQRDGLNPPEAVLAATKSYREEQDVLASFLADACIVNPLARATKTQLRTAYEEWCRNNAEEPLSVVAFRKRLVDHGFTEERSSYARFWHGIGVRDTKQASTVPEGKAVTHDRL